MRGQSALDVARSLLVEFGSLSSLLTADRVRLCEARGLGPARYVVLQASLELARRHYQELIGASSTLAQSRPRSANSCRCGCATCPTRCSAASGWTDVTASSPSTSCSGARSTARAFTRREVVKQALSRNAAAVILAHNHPSGVAEPSAGRRTDHPPAQGGPGAGGHPVARPPGRRGRGLRVVGRAGPAVGVLVARRSKGLLPSRPLAGIKRDSFSGPGPRAAWPPP